MFRAAVSYRLKGKMIDMGENTLTELISEKEIMKKVMDMASSIERDFIGKELTVIAILKGGFVFAADLVRNINLPLEIAFMAVSSYGASAYSSGELKIRYDIDISVEGKNIIIVEDIIDTGLTMNALKEHIMNKGACSVKICAVFDKPDRRVADVDIDYKGFTIPNEFVVGYGLDYNNKYRNLKGLYKITL